MTSQEYSMRMQEIQDQYRNVQAQLDEKENEAETLRTNLMQTVAEKEIEVTNIEVSSFHACAKVWPFDFTCLPRIVCKFCYAFVIGSIEE